MAAIEIGPLGDRLGDDEIVELTKALKKAGTKELDIDEDASKVTVAKGIDGDVLAEFLDHLDASEIACDVYLPIDFDGSVEAAELQFGSIGTLLDVLEELKAELDIDEEEDEEEDDDEEDEDEEDEDEEEDDDEEDGYELRLVEKQLKQLWKYFYEAATGAQKRELPMFVIK